MKLSEILIIIVFLLGGFLFIFGTSKYVSGYSTYGKPTSFGNLTTTTCNIGGDDGIVNCTGNFTSNSNWFNGLFNWSTSGAFISFTGSILSFSSTNLNSTLTHHYQVNRSENVVFGKNITADYFIGNYSNESGALEFITPSMIYDVDDEDVESDLNTYVDIAGDEMTGGLNVTGNITLSASSIYSWKQTKKWRNQSDGENVLQFGLDVPLSMVSNTTDLFILDGGIGDEVVYHLTQNWTNLTDSFSVSNGACTAAIDGLTWNGSDFWVVDHNLVSVCHYNSAKSYVSTDDVDLSTNTSGALENPQGITTNGSDFWITDWHDDKIYRFDSEWNYLSNFYIGVKAANPRDITTNGSDLWLVDSGAGGDEKIYHYLYDGTYVDEIDLSITHSGTNFWGLTTDSFYATNSGSPEEFFVSDNSLNYISRIRNKKPGYLKYNENIDCVGWVDDQTFHCFKDLIS